METLLLKRTADAYPDVGWPRTDTDWVVLADGHVIGSIKQVIGGPRSGMWAWTLTAVIEWRSGTHSGDAPTLEDAMSAFKVAWVTSSENRDWKQGVKGRGAR